MTLFLWWMFSSAQFVDYSNSRLYHSDWLLFDTPADADVSSVDASQLATVSAANSNNSAGKKQLRKSSGNAGSQAAEVQTTGAAHAGSSSGRHSSSDSSSGRQGKAAPGYQAATAAALDMAPDDSADTSDNSGDSSVSNSGAPAFAQNSQLSSQSQQSNSQSSSSHSSKSSRSHLSRSGNAQLLSAVSYAPGAVAVQNLVKKSNSVSSTSSQQVIDQPSWRIKHLSDLTRRGIAVHFQFFYGIQPAYVGSM